jgi:hypothetical protein
MHNEGAAKTVIVVGSNRPEPNLQEQMEARGIRVQWARTINEAAALLNSGINRNRCRYGTGS